jgi:hypothetical protein
VKLLCFALLSLTLRALGLGACMRLLFSRSRSLAPLLFGLECATALFCFNVDPLRLYATCLCVCLFLSRALHHLLGFELSLRRGAVQQSYSDCVVGAGDECAGRGSKVVVVVVVAVVVVVV